MRRNDTGGRHSRFHRNDRGAALIIVAAIIVILGTIALSFFTMTRSESRTATNVTNLVRADHLVDSSFAIGIARLNQDLHQHPQATSTDHSWRTFFNGAWAAGKPWMMRDGAPLSSGGMPLIDMRRFEGIIARFSDGYVEALYKGPRTTQWLFIPRFEPDDPSTPEEDVTIYDDDAELVSAYDYDTIYLARGATDATVSLNNFDTAFHRFNAATMPFLTADFYGPSPIAPDGYPAEQAATWADVDNDGDGLNDSVWFPIGADVFRSDDGIDNNLNGVVDEQGEAVTYVYHGLGSYLDPAEGDFSRPGDGLDNDGVNGVDDPGEDRLFLTAPILGTVVPVDINNDGVLNEFDRVEDADENCVQLTVIFPSFMTVLTAQGPVPVTQADVDALDNDFDLLANNYRARAYFNIGLGNQTGLKNLDLDATGVRADLTFYPSTDLCFPVINAVTALDIAVAHSGEPECELMGRAAVYISDESSKVNLNIAGAESYHELFNPNDPTAPEGPMMRAIADGVSPFEYDTRVLPDIGIAQASKLWGLLVGAPDGVHLPVDPDGQLLYLTPTPGPPAPANPLASYEYDLSFPGYGRVDDNANALTLAMNGIDDDGDGLVDEGLYLPNAVDLAIASDPVLSLQAANTILNEPDHIRNPNVANTILNAQQYDSLTGNDRILILDYVLYQDYFERLGLFEGIDEPAELQRFSPLRNMVAEGVVPDSAGSFDLLDNDDDGSVNQPGELGDRQLQNLKQIMDANNVGQGTYDSLRNLTTVFSTERGVNAFKNDAGKLVAFNKLNPDLATPQQIAAKLMLDNNFAPVTNNFALMAPFDTTDPLYNDAVRAQRFAVGLRQGAFGLTAPTTTPGEQPDPTRPLLDNLRLRGGILHIEDPDDPANPIPTTNPYQDHAFPIDPQLEAMQLAVDLADSRDEDHERSVLTTEPFDTLDERFPDGTGLESSRYDPWPLAEDLNDRERLKASGNSLLPLEEIQDFASSTLHLTRNLEIVDEWWGHVNADGTIEDGSVLGTDSATGDTRVEERHISYTAAGQEAVRINEIMVRPVRRIEAETDIGEGELDPAPYAGMLDFTVQRDTLDELVVREYLSELTVDHPIGEWNLWGSVLGGDSGWGIDGGVATVTATITDPNTEESTSDSFEVPDILQYSIVGSDGLPEGNYYLTIDMTDADGNPTVGGVGDFAYAIKYTRVDGPDIIDDFGVILSGDNPGDFPFYWDANWVTFDPTLPLESGARYISGRPGEPEGWMFLDGSPGQVLQPDNGRLRGYFAEYPGEVVKFPLVGIAGDSCAQAKLGVDGLIYVEFWLSDTMLAALGVDPMQVIIQGEDLDPVSFILPAPAAPGLMEIPPLDPTLVIGEDPDTGDDILLGDAWRDGLLTLEVIDAVTYDTLLFGPMASAYCDGFTDSQFPHTIYIPSADSGWRVCIAFAADPAHPLFDDVDLNGDLDLTTWPEISINSLDFSQEPDHEYAELVNVSDQPVDIGGWTLEVGIPAVQNDDNLDPYRTRWLVPAQETIIAPGGMVLLGFDKFDNYRTFSAPVIGPDTDQDGMSDAWEITHGMDRLDDGTGDINNGPLGDINGNGMSNLEEYRRDMGASLVYANGMGLAASDTIDGTLTDEKDLLGVTVPPVADNASAIVVDSADPLFVPALRPLYDPTGSVFERFDGPYEGEAAGEDYLTDYVDRDGDGFTSAKLGEGELGLYGDTDDVRDETKYHSTPTGGLGDKPWDRIIMLTERVDDMGSHPDYEDLNVDPEIPRLQDANTVEALAHWVLRGGVFPNYPERDRIDNDGDGAYVREDPDSGEWYYAPGTLDKDMVDNNLDGSIDDGSMYTSDGDDNDLDGAVDELDETDIFPNESEGVDEGAPLAGRDFGAGSFEPGILPVTFVDDRGEYQAAILAFAAGDPRGIDVATATAITSLSDPYLGSNADPPDWKAFAERRWYPGDNVIVTLYDGDPPVAGVVDRVTYRELDLTNRTVDDIEENPYAAGGLNPDYPTFWAPDQMGLDFYRSLERKHPLYSGDRFGTSNRWEATDGNYDDWADSVSVFAFDRYIGITPGALPGDPPSLTVGALDPDMAVDNERLLGHTLWGSPLRMNLAQRLSENPKDLGALLDAGVADLRNPNNLIPAPRRVDRQFYAGDSYEGRANLDWTYAWSKVADTGLFRAGELAALPHATMQHAMFDTSDVARPFLYDDTHVNMGFHEDTSPLFTVRQDLSNRGAVLGASASRTFLAAATDMISTDALTLTVGQADFTPILPAPADLGISDDGYRDEIAFASAQNPRMWAPIFLFQLPPNNANSTESYNLTFNSGLPLDDVVPQSYLFNRDALFGGALGAAFLGGAGTNLNQPLLAQRWPLMSRAIMYVSQNQADAPAEALFAWDASDGLENGEYAAYVCVNRPATSGRLLRAEADWASQTPPPSDPLLLDFAIAPDGPLEKSMSDPFWDLRQVRLGLEFITDRANASKAALPLPAAWKPGVFAPGEDGVIFYGNQGGFAQRGVSAGWLAVPVNVTENFLALRVRNMGEEGSVATITQVILAPRKRTTGKINVNTAETRKIDNELFNPLLGLPGVLDARTTLSPRKTDTIIDFISVDLGIPIPFDDNVDPPNLANGLPEEFWPTWLPQASPYDYYGPKPNLFTDPNGIVGPEDDFVFGSNPLSPAPPDNPFPGAGEPDPTPLRLSALMTLGRPQHVDGRYYTSMADLIGNAPDPALALAPRDVNGNVIWRPTPLSNESEPSHWFGEVYERLRRMSNLVTFRGDVFEIVVKVQTGFLIDADADGRLNYRSNQDFNITGEMPGRMVYERRTPADRAGEGLGR